MRNKLLSLLTSTALLISMPLAPLGQTSGSNASPRKPDASTFIIDMASFAPPLDGAYRSETKKIASSLALLVSGDPRTRTR